MFRIPWEEFLDWQDTHNLAWLPGSWRISARIRITPAKGLPAYLKEPNARGIEFRPMHPKGWLKLVAVVDNVGRNVLRRKGWNPETVEVFLRWRPKR